MSSCTVIDAWELKGYNAIIAIANWIRATSRLGPSPISILFFSAFSSTFFCVSVKTGVYPPPPKNDEHYDVVPIVLFPVLLLTIRLCKFSLKESLFFFSYQDGTLPVSAGRIFYRIGTLPANSLHNCTGCVCVCVHSPQSNVKKNKMCSRVFWKGRSKRTFVLIPQIFPSPFFSALSQWMHNNSSFQMLHDSWGGREAAGTHMVFR